MAIRFSFRRLLLPAVLLATAIIGIFITSLPATATGYTFTPVADSYVNASFPTSNYGTDTLIWTDVSPDIKGYLRFDVQNLDGPVTSATLRVFSGSTNAIGFDVLSVADTSWVETGSGEIIYNNAPAMGSVINSSGSVSLNSWVEIDVTNYISADGLYSFGITTGSNNPIRFLTRESTNPPELIIETGTNSTATNTPTPTETVVPGGNNTFSPEADAFVRASSSGNNYGNYPILKVRGGSPSDSYLRFNVQGISGTISSAKLRLYTLTTDTVGFTIHQVADNSWDELSITYDNAPAVGSTIGATGAVVSNTWAEIDVTSYVTGNGLISFGLTSTSSALIDINSREAGSEMPELVIVTDAGGTPTPTATPTPTNTPTPTTIPGSISADFVGSPINGPAPLAVTFTNNSSGNITDYLWDFGDGNSSTQASPVHTYLNSGVYTISLTVTGADSSQDTYIRNNYIFVDEPTVVLPNQSPVITITTPLQGDILGTTSITVNGEVTDDGVIQSVLINDSPATVIGNTFNTNLTVGGGNVTINAAAEDDNGLIGYDSIVIRVDDEGPAIEVETPQNRQSVYTQTPSININYSDFLSSVDTGSVEVQLTDENNITTDITSDLTVMANGAAGTVSTPLSQDTSYTLTISLADTLGNMSSIQTAFYLPTNPNGITLPSESADAGWASGIVYDSSTCNDACQGLAGVQITASAIDPTTRVTTPISGTIVSGPDGFFAFPFEATGFYTLRFEKNGFTYGQREVNIVRERSTATNNIYLTPLDSAVTTCDSNGCSHTNSNGTIELDIPPGAIPSGESIDVRATLFDQVEFLPGGDLPPGTWETYAFNLSGASEITFTRPITVQVANYRGFAPGTRIPLGYWNQETLQWEHESVGTVDETGQWLIMHVTHFSNFDCNDPIEASGLLAWLQSQTQTDEECAEGENGCYINTKSGTLREWIDLPTVNILGQEVGPQLEYSTERTSPTAVIDVQLGADVVGGINTDSLEWELYIEGEKTENYTIEADLSAGGEIGRYRFLWDGRNAQGQLLPPGVYDYAIRIRIPYLAQYCGTVGLKFGNPPDCERFPTGTYETGMEELWSYGSVNLQGTPDSGVSTGWTLVDQQHLYEDEVGRILVTENSQLTQYYSEVGDQLNGRSQYNNGQPPVLGPAAAIPIPPLPPTGTGTLVSGLISNDTTWSTIQSPYIVTGDVTVSDGITLTIEPGVQVMLQQEQSLIVEGALSAIGTPAQPITFTAHSDGVFQSWDKFGIFNEAVNNNVNAADAVAVDNEGYVWFAGCVACAHGATVTVDRLDPDQNTWTSFDFFDSGLFPSQIRDIAIDSQGQKWFATDAGVAVLSTDNQSWTTYTASSGTLADNDVRAATVDNSDNIWFATANGISRLSPGSPDTWVTYQQSDGLASNTVYSLAIEDDNTIWFGTAAGLSELTLTGGIPVFANYVPPLGNAIEDLAIDAAGNIWLIIPGGGLNVLLAGGGWADYSSGLLSTALTAILIDAQGQKWIGYDGNSLSILSPDNQEWTHEGPPKLGGDIITDLAEAASGDIWLTFDLNFSFENTVVTHFRSSDYFDGTISGGYWQTLQIGGGSNLTDSNSSELRYVTIEAGGVYAQDSLQIIQSTPTLDNVTVLGSGGRGLYATQSDGFILSNAAILANKGDGIVIEQGSGGHLLENVTVQANGGHGIILSHFGPITITGSLFADNDGYGIYTTTGSNELDLQDTTLQRNNVAARFAVNTQLQNTTWLDNELHQLEWVGGTMNSDHTWSPDFNAHIIVGDITVADGVTLTLEPGTNVLFTGSPSLLVNGTLMAVGTPSAPIYLGPAAGASWSQLHIGGGAPDSDDSHLRYVIIQDNATGLWVENSLPTLEHLTFIDNVVAMRVSDSEGLTIVNSNFARIINDGIINLTPEQTITAVNNYWGDSSGPVHPTLNPAALGASVSDGVDFIPWYQTLVAMDGVERYLAGRTATDNTVLTFDEDTNTYTRHYPDGRSVHFDTLNRHDYTLYPDGRSLNFTYNVDGTTATMSLTAPGESTPHWIWSFNYSSGKLDSITDPAGRTTDFTVDDNGHLTAVDFPDNSSEQFFYDARGLLTQHVDRNDEITSYTYDQYGRIQSDIRPIREVYDPVTGQASALSETRTFTPSDTAYPLINESVVGDVNNPAPAVPTSDELVDGVSYGTGQTTGLTNEWGNWTERTDATGRTTGYDRDEANNVTSLNMPNGDCLNATYDDQHNLLAVARIEAAECDQAEPTNVQTAAYSYEPRFNQIKTITDARGNSTTYVYDYEEGVGEQGLLIRIEYPPVEDENGVIVTPTVSYTYNSLGLVDTETDARGTLTRYVYTQGTPSEAAGGANPLFAPGVTPVPGLLTQIIEDDGGAALTTTYKDFDALGNPLTVIGPGGSSETTFLYDDMGRVISQTDAVGMTVLSLYNDRGNLMERTTDYTADGVTGHNVVTTFRYDADNRLINERTIADGLVVQTSYAYDINGNLVRQTDGRGNETRFEYDDANRLTKVIDATGEEISYTYDQNGRIQTITDAEGYVTRTSYDAFGRVQQRIQDEGGLNLTATYTYDLNNNLETVTAPDGTVTCYEYDSHNRQTAVVQDCGSGGLALRSESVYDLNGNPVAITNERGIVTYNEYDPLNRVTLTRQDDGGLNLETAYTYDAAGNLNTVTDERGIVTEYDYDDLNRMESSCADTNGLNLCTTYAYDSLHNQESVTDPNGVTQFTTFNAFGLPTQMIADLGGLAADTSYAYDDNLNLIRYTDDNGNSTIYTYTPRNELERETYADGTTVDYSYDGRGLIFTRIDQASETLAYTHDGAGRNTAIAFSGGGSQSFQYDAIGRVTYAGETANGHTSTLTYGYNALGDVISTTQQLDGIGGSIWQVDYGYDYAAGTYTVSYPSGVDAVYTLDPLGRLDLVQQDDGGLAAVADYTYNDLNSFFEISYGNNAANRFDYDALFRTTQVQLTSGANTLADYGYGYDNAGNRTYLQRNHLVGSPADVYQYDTLYQLTQAWYGADATTPGSITAYDDLQTYTLDTVGNRLEVAFDDGSSTTTQTYGPNNSAQLTDSMNQYQEVDGNSLSYDPRGNTLADGVTTNSYGYDVLNRQISVDDGSTSAEYIYDAMGRRIAKVVDGVTTYFIYDKRFRVIEERSGATVWDARYTYGGGIDEPLMLERNGNSYYLHRDALGSVTEVTDSNGALVERYEYDVYGQPLFFDGSYSAIAASAIGNPYLFTGRRYDPESGNYYYRARIYSPALGRFLSMDPLGYEAGDANLYRYAFNNPANLTDPTGEFVPLVAAVLLAVKAIDYGLTAYDIWQSTQTIADPCSTAEEILFASLNLALAVVFEIAEPDELLPTGVPLDDVARRLVMNKARRAFQEEGIEGFVRIIKSELGDHADDVLRQLELDNYIDDVAEQGDEVVDVADNLADDVAGAICSFSGDTLVSTADGLAAISTLEEGDYVLAYDEATGTIGYYPILATWVHEDPVIVFLTIDGELIETTPEHPFYTADGDWVAAGDLQAGDHIQQADGTTGTVEAINIVYRLQPMYNLTVSTAHTFFVGDGQWLVHNDCIIRDVTANQMNKFWRSANSSWGPTWEALANSGNVIAYQSNGNVVGAVAFGSRQNPNLPEPALYMMALEVLPEYRNKGIGSTLLGEAASESLKRGYNGNVWSVVNKSQSNWPEIITWARTTGAQITEEAGSFTLFFPK